MPTAQEIAKAIQMLNGYVIELGVFTSSSNRTENSNGMTNADIMFINEFGSAQIPSRPVLDKTLNHARITIVDNAINNCINGICNAQWGQTEIEAELNRACVRIEDYAKQLIYQNNGTFTPNSPATINGGWVKVPNSTKTRTTKSGKVVPIKSVHIEGKGFDHPLFNTGQLANSIKCRLIKK